MSAVKEQKMVRVQLDMPVERMKDIQNIMARTGVSTRKDIFENALALFEWAVNERTSGRIIASIDKTEEGFHEVVMPALASVKNEAKHKNGFSKL